MLRLVCTSQILGIGVVIPKNYRGKRLAICLDYFLNLQREWQQSLPNDIFNIKQHPLLIDLQSYNSLKCNKRKMGLFHFINVNQSRFQEWVAFVALRQREKPHIHWPTVGIVDTAIYIYYIRTYLCIYTYIYNRTIKKSNTHSFNL